MKGRIETGAVGPAVDPHIGHNNEPLVSVVICNYNCAKYVGEAIESVLRQTYRRYEVIVVDDGSDDKSAEVIGRYGSTHTGLFTAVFQQNEGQASALNAGYSKCRGDIVAFLDSDDWWTQDKIEKVVQASHRHDYAIVQHNLLLANETGNTEAAIWPGTKVCGNVLARYFIENHVDFFSSTSGIASHRQYLDRVLPLDESWRICADVPLTRSLALFGPVLTLAEPLGYYRIHSANNWTGTANQRDWVKNRAQYCQFVNAALPRYGINRKIDFTRSIKYKTWRLSQCRAGLLHKALLYGDLVLSRMLVLFRLKLLSVFGECCGFGRRYAR